MRSSQRFVWFSKLLKTQDPVLFSEIVKILERQGISFGLLDRTNDIWCRDYLPVSNGRGGFVQFAYNPSYLQFKKYYQLITDPVQLHNQLNISPSYSSLVLDGGNIVRSLKTVIMTDMVHKDNPDWSVDQIRSEIICRLNVEKVVIIPRQPNDFTGHADGMVRLLDERSILINDFSKESPVFQSKLKRFLDEAKLNPFTLPYAMDYSSSDTTSAVGTYINFLKIDRTILLPAFGLSADDYAEEALHLYYPGHDIFRINCLSVARKGGVLNCLGWVYEF